MLRGDDTDTVLKFGHQTLPTFGCGTEYSKAEWRSIFRQLYASGLAEVNVTGYGEWMVTKAGWEALKGEREVWLRRDALAPISSGSGSGIEVDPADNALLKALKKKRMELAREHNSPAYVIFTDRTLSEIASVKPKTLEALSACHGVGEAKLKRFGKIVLEIVGKAA